MRAAQGLLGVALAAASTMQASRAAPITEICYAPEQGALVAMPPDGNTLFDCPVAGMQTVMQLAQQGYRIVRLTPTTGVTPQTIRQQLLVQRARRVHASGFER